MVYFDDRMSWRKSYSPVTGFGSSGGRFHSMLITDELEYRVERIGANGGSEVNMSQQKRDKRREDDMELEIQEERRQQEQKRDHND